MEVFLFVVLAGALLGAVVLAGAEGRGLSRPPRPNIPRAAWIARQHRRSADLPTGLPGEPDLSCRACGTGLVFLGRDKLRVGGTTGGWKLLFGEFAELGEDMIELDFLACPACRRVELRLP